MSKEEILIKHLGLLPYQEVNGRPVTSNIELAMDEHAKEQSIAFAEWIADGPWVKVPPLENVPADIWYIPSDNFDTPSEELTTHQLYTLFSQQQIKIEDHE